MTGVHASVLVDALPAAAVVEDARRRVLAANEGFCRVFGLPTPASRLAGADAADLARHIRSIAADPGLFCRRIDELTSAGESVAGEEIRFVDSRVYNRDYAPLRTGSRLTGHLWIYRDVTAERTRTDHLTTLSHELRTPLTSIISFAGLLRESPGLPPDGAEFAGIIERNAERMLRLAADLMILARLESGTLPLNPAPTEVATLVREIVRASSPAAAGHGVTLSAEETGGGPLLMADRHRLLQVLDNLISNAIKFTGPGGWVRVTAAYGGAGWRIDVADSGMGIPRDEQARLFDRFFRATNARAARVPGTGLGLSVVRAIVELHGGRIVVRSTPGEGATFSLFLPACQPGFNMRDN